MKRATAISAGAKRRAPRPRTRATPGTLERGAIAWALLDWYEKGRRDLPWRRTRDPYAVWVSEMMLQQTQVKTVLDYYERWMRRFPTVDALARAKEADVLHAWQGLGYYSRARNLWRGARAVLEDHGGRVPSDVDTLRSLPGIGPYSAGAIASIAHGVRTPLVDGNVVRVLCRLFGLRGDPTRAPLKSDLWELAASLVPGEAPGDFNQGLMELGATVCTPRAPACDRCPLRAPCTANRDGMALELPESPKRAATVPVARAAAIVTSGGRVLVVQVPEDAARWAGMWQFPNTDVDHGETAEAAARRAVREAVALDPGRGTPALTVRHSVTRYRITLDAFDYQTKKPVGRKRDATFAWKTPSDLDALAMPAAHRRIAKYVQG
jgi:A/G-specific adenine glycosylase